MIEAEGKGTYVVYINVDIPTCIDKSLYQNLRVLKDSRYLALTRQMISGMCLLLHTVPSIKTEIGYNEDTKSVYWQKFDS